MEELVRKAQKGDDEAFYLIMSNVKARLYNTAYNYLRNEASALEAVSEATCRAYIYWQIKGLQVLFYMDN